MTTKRSVHGVPVQWETLPALVAARAAQHGDAPRLTVAGRAMSYRELDAESSLVAANLHRLGVGRGDRIACFLRNAPEHLVTWVAAGKLGAIWVPLNAGLVGEDLVHTLTNAAPAVLVVDAELAERVADVEDRLPPMRVYQVEEGGRRPAFAELLEPGAALPAVEVSGGDPAVIIYTGGTTGLPKGALLPHFAWIAAGMRYVEAFETKPDDVHYSILTLFHVGGLMLGVVGPMVADIPTVIDSRFSGSNFWARARETGATIVDLIGTMVTVLTEQPEGPADRDHRVRVSLGVTGQIPPAVSERFVERFGAGFVNVYSLTETGGVLIVNNRMDSPKPRANGLTHGWAEVAILDDGDQPMPPGVIGQIALRPRYPDIFMSGYFNAPERTLECLSNLWLHTGDLGHLDEDGFLFFTGRQAHWLRRRGENISAYEVESVLSHCPGVREVVVVGAPSEKGEEEVKAFVIRDPGCEVVPAAIAAWCEGRMAAFKIPRFIAFVEEFPRSVTKREVERHKLRALPNDGVWDREAPVSGGPHPREDRPR
ncbi:AMP-binding protein [Azospirillum doebereinerae]|uniref:AMP-binding protein n=1 Tax=Azospirillum doebereinerae TaxID=92933 RepID=UPI001EE55CD5|nr:AMP-binding protein [Azospirillum doebereinerae]MCG5238811.1 AMP-binding protein [Azospirillum doebereinerae]